MEVETISTPAETLSPELFQKMDAYWRAANYLSVGQIYLYDNPLLKKPLMLDHIKPRLLGHWGTTPGLNFIYVHLNHIIKIYDLNIIYITGPGHGGPGLVANTYLEGTYSEFYPDITQDEEGMKKLFKQFSFPGGIPSHVSAETPGSINEGGELGYSLVEPDVVMACSGDAPTLETIAAVQLLREQLPEVKVRVVNVIDLMTLQSESEHPHGLNDKDFDMLFTKDKPIIFAFHGYPSLIHRLTYRRTNHKNLHVRGYKGEGTTTKPFDMVVLNDLDRFHVVGDVIDRLPHLGSTGAYIKEYLRNKLLDHKAYIELHGEDMPEILNWKWKLISFVS